MTRSHCNLWRRDVVVIYPSCVILYHHLAVMELDWLRERPANCYLFINGFFINSLFQFFYNDISLNEISLNNIIINNISFNEILLNDIL